MKRKILFLAVAILTLAMLLTACGGTGVKKATSLTLVDETVTKTYTVGDKPDFSGVKAVVSYSDGTAETVTADKLSFSSLDTSSAGTKTLTITYKEVYASVDITVVAAEATLESIKIVDGTVSRDAIIGSAYDVSGIQVEAVYSDGTKVPLNKDSVTITLPDTETVGEKTLTVTYEGKTDSITVTVSGISSIQIVAGTVPGEIFLGETLDTSNLEAIITYSNSKTEILKADKLTVGEFDTSEIGEKALKISYKGFEVEHKINVIGVTFLEVNAGSVQTSVKVFGSLDVSRITAKATYNNGTVKSLAAADLMVKNIDTSTVGTKKLEVSYSGKVAYVDITVVGVETITVTSSSLAGEILVGETLSTSEVKANVVYTDGSTEVVDAKDLKFGEFDSSSAGSKTLEITYLDKTVEYSVKVCGIEGIRVEGVSRVVVAGEELDLTNMKVYAVYSDSKKTEVLLTEGYTDNKASLDFDVEGQKTLIITYGEFTANVVIDTTHPELVGLEIRTYDKVIGLGQTYDKTSVSATAIYGNGTTEVITSALLNVSSLATDAAGNVTLTVSYTEEGVTKEASVTVKVLPITALAVSGIATVVDKNGTLDTDGVKVTVTFSDGTDTLTEVVDKADGVTVSALDTASAGDKSVTVSYLGSDAEYAVHVKGIKAIKILQGSYDSAITHIENLDTSKLEIEIEYTNGDKAIGLASEAGATVSTVTADDGKSISLTVTLDGASANTVVKVLKLVSIHALNGTVPTSVVVGQSINYNAIRLTAIYEDEAKNQYTYLISLAGGNLEITEIDTSTPGEKAVIFHYNNMSATVVIAVKGIESLSILPGTLQTTIGIDQTVDTGNLQLIVTFTDGSYTYVDTTDINLNIDAKAIDTSKAGDYVLKITYRGTAKDIVITVKDTSVGNNMIFGISLPDSLVARDSYKNNFKDPNKIYVVGDDNPYRFYLNVLILDENDKIVDVDGRTVKTAAKIYLIEDGQAPVELTGDALTKMVLVDSEANTYDFTEEAIGKTFKISVVPAENYASTFAAEHTVKIVDAYNVYTAKELNVITNVDDDLNGGMEGNLSQMAAVNKFLEENGIERPSNLAGVVIHENLDIKPEDIPAEYIYTYTKDGVQKTGFYDHMSVFNYKNTHKGLNFTLYGNYYSIYSYSLPSVAENGFANNDDPFSSSEIFRFRTHESFFSSTFNHNEFSTNIVDVAFRDNDPNSNDQSASSRHMLGLICLKPSFQVFNVTNTNIDAYIISMVPECDNLVVNLDKVKFYNAWQGHLFLWNKNHIQEHLGQENADPLAFHEPMKINITDSLLAKCGGPVILAQSDGKDLACNKNSGADIVADGKSELYSYVTGQEAWFVAMGQTAMAAQILALDHPLKSTAALMGKNASFLTDTKISGVQTVNMILVNMGTGTTLTSSDDFKGTMTIDGTKGLDMTNNPIVDAYTALGAPTFQSSAGGTCATDGSTTCFGIETGAMGAPTANCFDGEYITLYYLGIGIMLEYYH